MNDDEIKKVLDKWGEDTVLAIQEILVSNDKIASQQLVNSIKFFVGDDFIKFTMAEYGKYIDITAENPAPRTTPHWTPIAPLKQWARLKGYPEKAAYQARWAIHKRGSKRLSFFQNTIQNEVQKLLPQLDDAVLQFFTSRMRTVIVALESQP